MDYSSIDIFCHVVDNFGDIGVASRLALSLKASMSRIRIRLFVDDLKSLSTVHPELANSARKNLHGVCFLPTGYLLELEPEQMDLADVLIETFACRLPDQVMHAAAMRPRVIINIDHLSAEPWVEEYHLQPSLLGIENIRKYFFMPGFTPRTGGLLLDRQPLYFREYPTRRRHTWLRMATNKIAPHLTFTPITLIGSIFSYVRGFDTLLSDLQTLNRPVILLVFGEKSIRSMLHTLDRLGTAVVSGQVAVWKSTTLVFMPFLPQARYDTLLKMTDFNIVRGEDSLVRALLAGKPFIWNAYLQQESYQLVKSDALLNWMKPFFNDNVLFESCRSLFQEFNSPAIEDSRQTSTETYLPFLINLPKIEHVIGEMNYFIRRNCNLIENFSTFLSSLYCLPFRRTEKQDNSNNT